MKRFKAYIEYVMNFYANYYSVAAQNSRQNFSTFLSKVFRKYFPI